MMVSCLMIWTLAIVYNIPFLFFYDTISFEALDIEFCYFNENNVIGLRGLSLANFIVWYILPLILIGVMYTTVAVTLCNTSLTSTIRLRSCSTHNGNHRPVTISEDVNASSPGINTSASEKDSFVINNEKADKEDINQHICSREEIAASKVTTTTAKQLTTSFIREPKTTRSSHKTRNISVYKNREIRPRKINAGRHKVIRLLVVVVVSFAVCVLPHHLKTVNHFWNIVELPHSVDMYFSPISFIVLYLNSCLNPVLYALFSTNFRTAFSKSLACLRSQSN